MRPHILRPGIPCGCFGCMVSLAVPAVVLGAAAWIVKRLR